ncbi:MULTISPECIES: hypothetical protein [unclassified Arthrobacter]|uniref:hypothetical protein n=1 Tax=unclassified Arthrobacter TaxID=235627 RepID=UPI001E333DA6|nr:MULTISPECIES: hypothetical protein [unclassified Arthrobacter]MCC9145600.1 hypothetical protein [Arthrobacter sp. zg-Y919]MDK1276829.1 hypothetical protein [Arthrobacter sp. zg.Y919]WIB04233.1 hypothetical protein QNO10_06180 [Arthrobacter sp. zg-Y919]
MPPSQTVLELLPRIAAELQADGPLTVGTMFRSPGLRTGTKIVAFLGSGDYLMVKLPQPRAAELIAAGAAEPVTMGRRTMREWIEVPAAADLEATAHRWTELTREALEYVRSLPG